MNGTRMTRIERIYTDFIYQINLRTNFKLQTENGASTYFDYAQ